MALMAMAVGAFSLMDACLKTLSLRYSSMQVTALRGLTGLPVVLVWIAATGGFAQVVKVRFGFHLARGALGIASLALFAYGVRFLPLSEAYAIFFAAPLLITVFAAVFLRERVGWQRWIVLGVGMIGVLIALRPTGAGAVSLPGLAILATAVCYALSAITVRVLGRTDSTQSMVFWLITFVAVGAGIAALPGWQPLRADDWKILVALAATGSIGQWGITEAFKIGEASALAPLEYTALLWGIGLDWVLWSTMPAARSLAGAGIVIISGIYLVRRERVHATAEHP